jgi:hypothetical protein
MLSHPEGPLAQAFLSTAEQAAARISTLALARQEEEQRDNAVPIQLFDKLPSRG